MRCPATRSTRSPTQDLGPSIAGSDPVYRVEEPLGSLSANTEEDRGLNWSHVLLNFRDRHQPSCLSSYTRRGQRCIREYGLAVGSDWKSVLLPTALSRLQAKVVASVGY